MNNYISTHSGLKLHLLNPEAKQISIVDIAVGLSRICRFGGQCERFYSVAEHCVRASEIVPPEEALNALLHDAPEAYLGDVTSPVKALLPDYRALYDRVERVIFNKYGVEMTAAVKAADLAMLKVERQVLMPQTLGEYWSVLAGVEVVGSHNRLGWKPETARREFLYRFFELYRAAHGIPNDVYIGDGDL